MFSARIGDAPVLIYGLLEHQSTADPRMPLRMLAYIVRIWERCDRKSPTAALPIVIPVVVTHAPHGWTVPTRMHALLRPDPTSIPGLAAVVPDFGLVLDDLTRVSDDALRARALALFPTLALGLLRDSHSVAALFGHLEVWASAFAAVAAAPRGMHAFERLVRYLELRLTEQQFDRFRARLTELAPTTEEAIMRFTEQAEARGEARGEAKGRIEAQRDTLRKLLELKFGALDDATLARVLAAAPAELERWLERILTARHLDAVFER